LYRIIALPRRCAALFSYCGCCTITSVLLELVKSSLNEVFELTSNTLPLGGHRSSGYSEDGGTEDGSDEYFIDVFFDFWHKRRRVDE
jgi:hypothetical protein